MKSGCRSCALAAASSSALGINRRKITHTSTSRWAMPVRSSAPIALRYSASIRAWAHTKLIRQIVLTVTGTELKSRNAASCSQPAPGAIVPQSRGGSRWPRTIRIREDASGTTAEPAIAVARDQVIDRVADHLWDELEDPCPLPARKRAQCAARPRILHRPGRSPRRQMNPGNQDRCRALSEGTSLGQLDRNEAKIAAAIRFAHEAAAARALRRIGSRKNSAKQNCSSKRTVRFHYTPERERLLDLSTPKLVNDLL
jgi:hypothetical protein